MNRTLLASAALVSISSVILLAKRADSQPAAKALVILQSTTPGTPQAGHSNVSGTSIAGQFIGGGGGLFNLDATNISTGTLADARLSNRVAFLNIAQTFSATKTFSAAPLFSNATVPFSVSSSGKVNNLNADLLDGLDSTAFLTGIPVPLNLSGANAGAILTVSNTLGGANSHAIMGTASSGAGRGVYGLATSTVGTTFGVYGESASSDARAVFGLATSATGPNYGGRFESVSTSGRGVAGIVSASSGVTFGVLGSSASTNGYGVYGEATASNGTGYGGYFTSASTTNTATALRAASNATTGDVRGIYATTASSSGVAIEARSTHASGSTYGGRFQTDSPNGIGVYASGGSVGLLGFAQTGVSGIGTSVGVDGTSSGASGPTYGGYFQNSSSSGAALIGTSGAANGVHGASTGANRAGVLGENTAASGSTIGVQGRVVSTSGVAGLFEGPGADAARIINTGTGRGLRVDAPSDTAVWATTNSGFAAVDGRNASTTGIGVFGNATAASGSAYGVRGSSASSTGRGVYGQATASSGISYGVFGEASSDAGFGVYGSSPYVGVAGNGDYAGGRFGADQDAVQGFAGATSGLSHGGYFVTDSTSGRSVFGANFETSGTTYGIYGTTSFSNPNAWSVWANDDLGAGGFKAFRIDHPEDPANKYLQHYAAESPEVLNIYSGKVTLDSKGEAQVEMHSYFARVNRDPRYSLTPIGAAMPNLHVVEEISEAALVAASRMSPNAQAPVVSFRVSGGVPGKRVSWEVKAIRNDRYAQARPSRVEVEKIGIEAGRYLHPELYGRTEDQGMAFRRAQK